MVPEKKVIETHFQEELEDNRLRSVGNLLRKTREEKGFTLSDVASETSIRQIYIQAIEEGEIDSLPGAIYKIGFIKNYAIFLDLDAGEILRQFGLNLEVPLNDLNNKYAVSLDSQRPPNKKILYLAILGTVGFSIFAYINHNRKEISERDQFSTPEFHSKGDSLGEVENKAELNNERLLQPERNNEIPLRSAEDFAQLGGIGKENLFLQPMLQQNMGSLINPLNTLPFMPDQQKKNFHEPPPLKQNDQMIIISIKDSWVQILDSSAKTIYVRLMNAGDTYKLPTYGEYTLNTGNAGGLKISCNGKTTRLLGNNRQVVRGINLTDEGLAAYFED